MINNYLEYRRKPENGDSRDFILEKWPLDDFKSSAWSYGLVHIDSLNLLYAIAFRNEA